MRSRRARRVDAGTATAVAVYDYTDENGKLLFQVLRTADKKFSPARPRPDAQERLALEARRHAPRPVPAAEGDRGHQGRRGHLRRAKARRTSTRSSGPACTATCNPGGRRASGARSTPRSSATRSSRIVADRDEPGQAHARQVLASLEGQSRRSSRSWRPPARAAGRPKLKDAADHLAAGHTRRRLRDHLPGSTTTRHLTSPRTCTSSSPS